MRSAARTDMDLRWVEFVPRYSTEEAAALTPYPGLMQFYEDRGNRDWAIGRGHSRSRDQLLYRCASGQNLTASIAKLNKHAVPRTQAD